MDSLLALLGRLYMPVADLVPTWCERLLASALGVLLILGAVVALMVWAWRDVGVNRRGRRIT